MAHCSRSRSSRSTRVEPCQSGVKARSGTVWTWTRTKEQADSDPLTRARLKKSPPRRVHGRASQAVQPSKRFEEGTISDHQMNP
jgi:hypothetical protein